MINKFGRSGTVIAKRSVLAAEWKAIRGDKEVKSLLKRLKRAKDKLAALKEETNAET